MIKLAERLRTTLKTLNLTQDEAAKKMGVSRLTINELVRGKRAVTADMAIRLEELTGVYALDWLYLQVEDDLPLARFARGRGVEIKGLWRR